MTSINKFEGKNPPNIQPTLQKSQKKKKSLGESGRGFSVTHRRLNLDEGKNKIEDVKKATVRVQKDGFLAPPRFNTGGGRSLSKETSSCNTDNDILTEKKLNEKRKK